jgi:hypothetical protein
VKRSSLDGTTSVSGSALIWFFFSREKSMCSRKSEIHRLTHRLTPVLLIFNLRAIASVAEMIEISAHSWHRVLPHYGSCQVEMRRSCCAVAWILIRFRFLMRRKYPRPILDAKEHALLVDLQKEFEKFTKPGPIKRGLAQLQESVNQIIPSERA